MVLNTPAFHLTTVSWTSYTFCEQFLGFKAEGRPYAMAGSSLGVAQQLECFSVPRALFVMALTWAIQDNLGMVKSTRYRNIERPNDLLRLQVVNVCAREATENRVCFLLIDGQTCGLEPTQSRRNKRRKIYSPKNQKVPMRGYSLRLCTCAVCFPSNGV